MRGALVGMADDSAGRDILGLLRLDAFSAEDPSLYDAIARKMSLLRALSA